MSAGQAKVVNQILLFGEDGNDRAALRVLIEGLRPDLRGKATVKSLRAPLTLIKGMQAARAVSRASVVVKVVRAAHRNVPVLACVFHEDTDAVEPASKTLATQIQQTYARCLLPIVPAVPAWEIEAWWYLFPDAVATTHPTWRRLDQHVGRDTGKIISPKERLRRDVRPSGRGPSASTYEEKHSEMIARAIVDGGYLHSPSGTSVSWTAFVAAVKTI